MAEIYFPLSTGEASWATTIQQSWETEVAKSASGRRRTLCQQTFPSWEFGLKFPMLTKAQIDALLGFYASCKGNFRSFWYMDWENHHVEKRPLARIAANTYQCVCVTGDYLEPAEKVTNVSVFVNDVETTNFTVTNGRINVSVNDNDLVTATYDYYYNVCFENKIQVSQIFNNMYSVSLKLSVVRE